VVVAVVLALLETVEQAVVVVVLMYINTLLM
jgi:hypothetical protein